LRLRAQGYGFEAIRETLADAGVHVSKSTVHREATRLADSCNEARPGALAVNDRSLLNRVTRGHWFTALLNRTKETP
jgi:hypothetical protein